MQFLVNSKELTEVRSVDELILVCDYVFERMEGSINKKLKSIRQVLQK